MKLNYEVAKRSKSLSYSLYSNEHLRDARIKVEQVFGPLFLQKDAISMTEINKRIEGTKPNKSDKDPELYASILTLLAHWENMALSIHVGIADEDVCYEMVASTLLQHVKVFRNFIDERRSRNPRIYMHLMGLQRRWADRLIPQDKIKFDPMFNDQLVKKIRIPKRD